jgi:hypothetical protein
MDLSDTSLQVDGPLMHFTLIYKSNLCAVMIYIDNYTYIQVQIRIRTYTC